MRLERGIIVEVKKLNKLKKRLLALSTACAISFSLPGCDISRDDNKEIKNNCEIENNIDLITLDNYVDSVVPCYKNEEMYLTDDEINNLIKISNSKRECKYKYDGNLDSILNSIRGNSLSYLKDNDSYDSCYDKFLVSDGIDFNGVLKSVLENIIDISSDDINEDMCNIRKLKIVIGGTDSKTVLAYYKPGDNMIVLNRDLIKSSYLSYSSRDYVSLLKNTLYHEINHCRQYSCQCRTDSGDRLLSFVWDDQKVSSLIESSAESQIYNLDKNNKILSGYDYSYSYQRKNEGVLLTLGLCRDDVSIEDYYNSILDNDLLEFFNFFGAHTKNEIYSLYKIIYSIETINNNSRLGSYLIKENKDIYDNYGQSSLEYLMGYGYKVDIFKRVINNMASYTVNHDDFSFEENIALFDLVKNVITYKSYLLEKSNISDSLNGSYLVGYAPLYDELFVKNIYELENYYVDFLSNYYNISVDDIRNYESDNGRILYDIGDICRNVDSLGYEYSDVSLKIVSKFPIVKAIVVSNINYTCGYDNFLEDNDLAYVKTK